MEKIAVILLLVSTWNLGKSPAETDVWTAKTYEIDDFGCRTPLFQTQKVEPKSAFSNPQKASEKTIEKSSQNAEAAFPPKVLFGF